MNKIQSGTTSFSSRPETTFWNARFRDHLDSSEDEGWSLYNNNQEQKDPGWSWLQTQEQRRERDFEEVPVRIPDSEYLYRDKNVDRFNAPPASYYEQSGQPKGVVVNTGPVTDFQSGKTTDDFFSDDLITSLNNEDNLIREILQERGGS